MAVGGRPVGGRSLAAERKVGAAPRGAGGCCRRLLPAAGGRKKAARSYRELAVVIHSIGLADQILRPRGVVALAHRARPTRKISVVWVRGEWRVGVKRRDRRLELS